MESLSKCLLLFKKGGFTQIESKKNEKTTKVLKKNDSPDKAAREKSLVDLHNHHLSLLIICDKQSTINQQTNIVIYVQYGHSSVLICTVCTYLGYQIWIVFPTNSCDMHKLSPPLPGLENSSSHLIPDIYWINEGSEFLRRHTKKRWYKNVCTQFKHLFKFLYVYTSCSCLNWVSWNSCSV